jgi:hypothetical protein
MHFVIGSSKEAKCEERLQSCAGQETRGGEDGGGGRQVSDTLPDRRNATSTLATSSTTQCTGACHVTHHIVYQYSPRHGTVGLVATDLLEHQQPRHIGGGGQGRGVEARPTYLPGRATAAPVATRMPESRQCLYFKVDIHHPLVAVLAC